MERIICLVILLEIFGLVHGQTCYFSYHHCTGYDWCCPDGYVCTGSSTCLSVGAIVGICIGAIFGIVFFAVLIYLCCRSKTGHVGTIVTQPTTGATVVTSGQYGQTQYGQPQYGQPQYGQPQYEQPGGNYPQQDSAYPPPQKS